MRYQEDPTPQGQARTEEELKLVQDNMRQTAILDALLPLTLMCLLVIIGLFADVKGMAPASAICAVIGAALVLRAWTKYRNEKAMSDETIGMVKRSLLDESRAPVLIKKMCKVAGVPEPALIGYSGWNYTGEYDPNIAAVTLGTPLQYYETDSALMAAAHEAAHHILLHAPDTKDKEFAFLRLAAFCDTLGICFALLMIIAWIFDPTRQNLMLVFSMFIISQIFKRGILTTHENRANMVIEQMYAEHPEVFEDISDIKRAFKVLYYGVHTYYADLALWLILGLGVSAISSIIEPIA